MAALWYLCGREGRCHRAFVRVVCQARRTNALLEHAHAARDVGDDHVEVVQVEERLGYEGGLLRAEAELAVVARPEGVPGKRGGVS